MTEKRISVGTVGYPIEHRRVHEVVDVVELLDGRFIPPRRRTARRLREDAHSSFAFTVQAPISVFAARSDLPELELGGERDRFGELQLTDENLGLWRRGLEFAAEVGAEALVLLTPGALTPAPANVKRLETFLAAVDRGGLPIVWEPRGPWETERAQQVALANDLVLSVDPLRDEPAAGPLAYLRLGPFAAMGSRVGVYDLERIAEAAQRFERAFCLFDTPRALDDARNLKRVLVSEPVD
ncbi:MAG: DUF72 domain-containing protein [Deltaproteobacteria bacterium]|nr:DUF72 domain-containing protein [Deltaproteobacteria bacterium]